MPKISGLPTATTVSPSDFIVLVDNAAVPETKKATANLLSVLAPVQTVAGRIGAVVLSSSDVGLGNVNNTADVNKPVSTAQQSALDLKAPIANPTFTGTVGGVTKSMVGLGNVDDTSDANKPVSTAQSTANTAVQNYAVQRANHTGTQTASTVSDFATESAKYGPVASVAGKTGTVLLAAGDVTGLAAVATSGSASDLSTGTLASARLPAATTSTLGAVSVGTGLSVTAGAVSANVQSVAGKTGAVTLALTDISGADNIVFSKISGITGATAIANIVTLSQAQYDALLTPDATTLYVIKDAVAGGPGSSSSSSNSATSGNVFRAIPTMTSDTEPSGVASALPQGAGGLGPAYAAFDNNNSTAAGMGYGDKPFLLQYDFGAGVKSRISGYSIVQAGANSDRWLQDWSFEGSDDGVNYVELDSRSGQTFTTDLQTYSLATSVAYRMFRLKITYLGFNSGTTFISSFQLLQ